MDAADGQGPLSAIRGLFAAIVGRDVSQILGHYCHDDRLLIFLEGPQSKVEGWDEPFMRAAWSELVMTVTFREIELSPDARAGESGDLGWVSGSTRMTYPGPGGMGTNVRNARGTWILQRQHGRWLIIAEHVSFPVPTPYPTGETDAEGEVMSGTYRTYCPQCEEWQEFTGEVVEASDGSTGAQGPCPECQTIITAMLAAPEHGA